MIGTNHNWTRNEDVLMCVYLNHLGEECWRTSRIAKGETEEQAKVRIMKVDLTYVPDDGDMVFDDGEVEEDPFHFIDRMRESAIDAALGEDRDDD